jgi:peroxiredoxin
MHAQTLLGKMAPALEISSWVQGNACTLDELRGRVVLIEVFQMNCPGCFLHALPEVAHLHHRYAGQGLEVIGLATAFEDFALNTLENLQRFASSGELIGEPLRQLGAAGLLVNNRLDIAIEFRLAMDRLSAHQAEVTASAIQQLIDAQIADYATLPAAQRADIKQRARHYLQSKTHHAHTFENYGLQGTPSSILIDRAGQVHNIAFGRHDHLETLLASLLRAH